MASKKKKPTKRKPAPRKAAVKPVAKPSKKVEKAAKKPNVEGRLTSLEAQVRKLTSRIERQFGEDIDGDGQVGAAMNKTVLTMALVASLSLIAISAFAGGRVLDSQPDATGTNVWQLSTDDDGTADFMMTGDIIVSNDLTVVGSSTYSGLTTFSGATVHTGNNTNTADIIANGNIIGDAATTISNVAEVVITAVTPREAVVAANLTKIGMRFGTATNGEVVTFSPVFQGVPSVTANWTDAGAAITTNAWLNLTIVSNTVTFSDVNGPDANSSMTNLSWIAVGNEE